MTLAIALVALILATTAWIAILWIAVKANTLATHLGPAELRADDHADTLTALAGDPVSASSTDRTVSGLIVPYQVPGDTSGGQFEVQPGAFALPADLSRVKLLREHDRSAAIGYLAAVSDRPDGLYGTFSVAPGPTGDEAIAAIRNRTRDGLSYEVSRVRYSADRSRVVAARLDAVALCSVPAYDDARAIAASRQETSMFTLESARAILADANASAADRAAAAAWLAANPAATDADRAAAAEASGNSPAAPAAAAAGTGAEPGGIAAEAPNLAAVTAGRPTGIALTGRRRSAALTAAGRIEEGIQELSATIRGSFDAGQVNAALADVVPGDDAGAGLIRPQWIGELWTAQNVARPFIDSIAHGTLTGLTVQGWKWEAKPAVGPYAGNKAEVPSNAVATVPASEPAERMAGGWDVDRAYFDLGDSGFLSAFFAAATEDYGQKTEARVAAKLLAGATVSAAAPIDLLGALGALAAELSGIGTSPSFIGISADLFSAYLEIPAAEAPWWLASQASVDLSGSSSIDGLRVFVSPTLPAGSVLGGNRKGATYYEASPSPIRVQAVNVAQGGIDLGVFGYDATLINDPRAIRRVNVAVGP